MESIFTFICEHANNAHLIFLFLLFLAGLNVPISEDVLLLTGGALVSRCIPDQYLHLYLWMLFGCWVSGWEAYLIGRLFGRKLFNYRFFNHVVNEERIKKLHVTYEKYGIWTFIVGRLIPGGVRNALLITSGMGKMPFLKFAFRDLVAAIISTNIMFYLGYTFGEHYEEIVATFQQYNRVALLLFFSLLCFLFFRARQQSKKTAKSNVPEDSP